MDQNFCWKGTSVHAFGGYISVAIEFENECDDAQVEMNKLQILNVPLTVLITLSEHECEGLETPGPLQANQANRARGRYLSERYG
jgi:hypothetical protein